jgi:hypothetical protein
MNRKKERASAVVNNPVVGLGLKLKLTTTITIMKHPQENLLTLNPAFISIYEQGTAFNIKKFIELYLILLNKQAFIIA